MLGAEQTLTVWNRYRAADAKVDVFYRYVIPVKCRYEQKIERTVAANAASTIAIASSQAANIPWTSAYKLPSEWLALEPGEREEYFTLQEKDLIALGTPDVEITTVAPYRESDVRQLLKPGVFSITAIQDNTQRSLGKHWRVEGV